MMDAARRLAAAIEASAYGTRLGFEGGEILADAATASVPYQPVLANAQGYVHGGVAASLSLWSAMLVAVSSDREQAASARPVSIAVSYLAAAREEALFATARLESRGRDIVHVDVEVASERGRAIATAQAVLRSARELPDAPFARAASAPPSERALISPFSQAMGIELRSHDASSASLAMRRDVNEGCMGSIDPAALLSLADICAALACLPSLDERPPGSATLSLSAIFGPPLARPALALGRQVAEDGGVRSALIEIRADGGERPARYPALTSTVAYRFVGAERC